MLPHSLSIKTILTIVLLLSVSIGGLLGAFKTETNTHTLVLNKQKKNIKAPINLTNSIIENRNKINYDDWHTDLEHPIIPEELMELESNYTKQQSGRIELQVSEVTPQELIDMEIAAKALGNDPKTSFDQYPAIEAEKPAIPEDLVLIEEEYQQLADNSETNFHTETESDIVPYELRQMEADPETSAFFDIDEPIETDTPALPDELISLEQTPYEQHEE